jgi:hypothetical protein
MWRRDEDLRIERAVDAERFIEDVGFANTLTDTRRAGPSLYIAVCGRRDVSLPRNVQKNEETQLTWHLKDEVMRRGRVYYAKLAGGRSMFVAPRFRPNAFPSAGAAESEDRQDERKHNTQHVDCSIDKRMADCFLHELSLPRIHN